MELGGNVPAEKSLVLYNSAITDFDQITQATYKINQTPHMGSCSTIKIMLSILPSVLYLTPSGVAHMRRRLLITIKPHFERDLRKCAQFFKESKFDIFRIEAGFEFLNMKLSFMRNFGTNIQKLVEIKNRNSSKFIILNKYFVMIQCMGFQIVITKNIAIYLIFDLAYETI